MWPITTLIVNTMHLEWIRLCMWNSRYCDIKTIVDIRKRYLFWWWWLCDAGGASGGPRLVLWDSEERRRATLTLTLLVVAVTARGRHHVPPHGRNAWQRSATARASRTILQTKQKCCTLLENKYWKFIYKAMNSVNIGK